MRPFYDSLFSEVWVYETKKGVRTSMGGHVLWIDEAEMIKMLSRIEEIQNDGKKHQVEEYKEAMRDIIMQEKLKMQNAIIINMLESGMTENQIAECTGINLHYITEIQALDSKSEYKYAYIVNAKTMS